MSALPCVLSPNAMLPPLWLCTVHKHAALQAVIVATQKISKAYTKTVHLETTHHWDNGHTEGFLSYSGKVILLFKGETMEVINNSLLPGEPTAEETPVVHCVCM